MKFWLMVLLVLLPLAAQAQNPDALVPLAPSQPSLWWISDRLGEGFIENWIIDQDAKLIRLQVNSQTWLTANYIKRYEIMQKLGNVALENRYDIVVENNRQVKLAQYKYEQGNWQITPPLLGATPFSANSGNFFGLR
ncbi:hypothetical protein Syn7502_01018 [Synechococcus sp. PCC 7502]|uniref:hypothetical protein n=1 Tax=Synechococcus sp. PCC 7502 TaxID=1173263 RepID=UPI00029FCC0E|nr:hypothetical protein [Synechococcus sp. PCC 7502]AFY73129.1 hypothetical protein Syn7502_01018 [Synechococcus sp. PCC 7502]